MDLPKNSFLIDGKEYDVPCVFQIWIKRDTYRTVRVYPKTSKFAEFVKKEDNPDIAVRRVGVYAGKLFDCDLSDKSKQSHYFLRVKNDKFIELYRKKVKFEHDNTVGPRSISKGELFEKINDMFS